MSKSGTTRKKILFIINPISGGRQQQKDSIVKLIEDHLDHTIYEYQFVQSASALHATELSKQAVIDQVDLVVAVGGDGSINQVARALIGTDTALGIIPAGSGNGLAHHLEIPTTTAEAVEIINRCKIKSIDSVNINDDVFFSVAGVGFDALVAKKYAQYGRRGFLPYFRIVTEMYPLYKPKKYIIKIDDRIINTRALMITLANSNQFGYNTVIAPTASLDDGLVDVCIVKKAPLIVIPLISHLVFTKKIDQSEYVTIIKASHVEIKCKKNRRINLDGESVKISRKLVINVNPRSIKVIVP
ncbi:MAG: diacylglycerol kinase family protein [Bacteroidales bacterium]|nr:diacylglycerol kinase family lipid kinase [Bacteroidales bacterium]MDZ4203176.1 diacylglycerol kinase family protein [Bacteroidales bacterium]